jgi:uncharacterized protein YggE
MPSNTIDHSKDFRLLIAVSSILLFLVGLFIADSTGAISLNGEEYVTVVGNSKNLQKNEVASFTATVTSLNIDKQTAVNEMNSRINTVIDSLRQFGIAEEDMQTMNMNVFQEQVWNPQTQASSLGDWRATQSVEVKLRDVSKAADLAALLSSLETSNVYGPNFTRSDESTDENSLMIDALEDARIKAEAIAHANGKRIGKMHMFVEGYNPNQVLLRESLKVGMGGGGADIVPGSTEVSKTVTVTYTLK